MSYLIAGVGVVLLIWALAWIGIKAPASKVLWWAKWTIITLVMIAVVVLLAMGLFRPAMMSGLLLLPILIPWRRQRFAQQQQGSGRPGPMADSGMTFREAADILGVAPDASADEIKAAHHELMLKHHPDKGGSPWFARRINEARDLLLSAFEDNP